MYISTIVIVYEIFITCIRVCVTLTNVKIERVGTQ